MSVMIKDMPAALLIGIGARARCTGARQIATGLNALARRDGKVSLPKAVIMISDPALKILTDPCHFDVHWHRHGGCRCFCRRVMEICMFLPPRVFQDRALEVVRLYSTYHFCCVARPGICG